MLIRRRHRSRSLPVLAATVALVGGLTLAVTTGSPSAAAADALVYGDSLSPTWQNWSWGATAVDSASPVASGTRSLAVSVAAPWGALSLRTAPPVPFGNGTVSLSLHGGGSGVTISLFTSPDDSNGAPSTSVTLSAPANTWVRHTITAAQLGTAPGIARLNLVSPSGASFAVDDVRVDPGTVAPTTQPPTTPAPATFEGSITVNAASVIGSVPTRMRGTNLGFYAGGYSYADATLRRRSQGVSALTRYPGTQDSQRWGWASCQMGTNLPAAQGCTMPNFTWTARPSDFIGFMQAVGGESVVTVNANATAKENAAFVAFMNGSVSDTRVIGVDQRGADWRSIGYWAQQRAAVGYPTPLGVKLWEFGNETYGGLPGGNQCVSYGWEVTWTCKATEFLDGVGTGAARQDGYRSTKAAMKLIDATIQVGFPAERKLDDYNGWTREAIANHRNEIDFFIVHPYFTWVPPADTAAGNAEILSLPQRHWSEISDAFNSGYTQYGSRQVPLLISEFNLTPGRENDAALRMNGIGNAIMMTDSVGVMSRNPLYMGANAFELYGSASPNGTYFGMMRQDGAFTRTALYWGWTLWSRFGSTLLDSSSTFDAGSTLSVYAGRRDANTLTLMVLNKSSRTISSQINVTGVTGIQAIVSDTAAGSSMADPNVLLNGRANPSDDLSDAPGTASNASGERTFVRSFAPWSMTVMRMTIGGAIGTTTTPTTAPPTTAPPTTVTTTRPPTTGPPTTVTPTTVGPTTLVPTTSPAGSSCRASYTTQWQGAASFGGEGTITNTGPTPINGWTLTFAFPGTQSIYQSWGTSLTQSGQQVTLRDAGWNDSISAGQSVTYGYAATFVGANPVVATWRLNGILCTT